MAFKLESHTITPGGLNLVAPGDQIAAGDCIDLTDWWAGSVGRLEQAPQLTVRNNPSIVTPMDSLLDADGRIYYGGGGSLYQVGRDGGGALESGYDGAPLGLLSYQGYAWIMNRGTGGPVRQRKDDGTSLSDWTPAAPAISTLEDGGVNGGALSPAVGNPPEVGGLDNAEYGYYTTWQLGTLGETNPSPKAVITPAVTGSIVRVHQAASAPANATGWNVYRRSPTFSTAYRLNEFTLDITRTYVDDYGDEVHTHSDTQLLQLGIIMETDHDAAPPARVLADQVYNGRILAASSAAHPNRIWFTDALQPGFFRGSANENEGNWVDVGTDKGDAVLAMIVKPSMVVIYRQRSIWRHLGDFGASNGGVLQVAVPDMGAAGIRAVAPTSVGDYFIGPEGVYKYNGDWAQKVSPKLDPLWRGLATENFPTLDPTRRDECAIGFRNGRLWCSYLAVGVTNPTVSFVYHVDTERWFSASGGYRAYLNRQTELLGAGSGIYTLESGYIAGPTILAYQSEYQDCNLPDHEKTWADLSLTHNTRGQTLTVSVRLNKSGTDIVLGSINSNALTTDVIPIVTPGSYPVGHPEQGTAIDARSLSVRIQGNGAQGPAPVIVDGPLILHYYVKARGGRMFDTFATDHGTELIKRVDQVEVEMDAAATGAVLEVYSDYPGGIMTVREIGPVALGATSGRQRIKVVLPTPADGRMLRYTVVSPTATKVYSFRARILPIGIYLDGAVSDFWQPQPAGIGV